MNVHNSKYYQQKIFFFYLKMMPHEKELIWKMYKIEGQASKKIGTLFQPFSGIR